MINSNVYQDENMYTASTEYKEQMFSLQPMLLKSFSYRDIGTQATSGQRMQLLIGWLADSEIVLLQQNSSSNIYTNQTRSLKKSNHYDKDLIR